MERRPNILRRLGMATVLTTAAMFPGSVVPSVIAEGGRDQTPTEAAPAACVPYKGKVLQRRDAPYSITAKRAIIVGDISIANKGLTPDSADSSRQMTVLKFPGTKTLTGIVSKYGDSYVEIFNDCATNGQFNAEVGRLELQNLPNGSAKSSVDTHKVTKTGSEPHTDPVKPCETTWIPIDIPATGENGVTALRNVKRAVITGDIKVQNANFDNNSNTGETIIVDLPSESDLTDINAPWGGNAKIMTPCASEKDFKTVIGAVQLTQGAQYSEGQQTFVITHS